MKSNISILIPVRNGLPYIKDCVDSALAQTFQNWEMIISDNGSTDGTLQYLDTLDDSRIRVYKQEHNLGIMGNVNFLFSQAVTPLSQILCADDYFTNNDSLDTIVDYWNNAPSEIGLVIFNYYGPSHRKINNAEHGVPAVIHPLEANLWFFTCGCLSSNLSSVSIRTHLVEAVGKFNENLQYAGDFDFWVRVAKQEAIGIQRERVVCVRYHDQAATITENKKAEIYLQQISVYEKLIEGLSATYSRKKLVDFFNYEVGTFHYRTALKYASRGKFGYMNQLLHAHSSILWPKWRQLLICLPIAILNLRERFTDHMSEKIINEQLTLYTEILNQTLNN